MFSPGGSRTVWASQQRSLTGGSIVFREIQVAAERVSLEQVVADARYLSPEDRVRLISRVAETLIPTTAPDPVQRLQYGEFEGSRSSTDEDFVIAEWRPAERDLDGP